MAKAPKYIQKKVKELHRTELFKIPELQKADSGWRIKPVREYQWVWHFPTEGKYSRWFDKINKALEKLGYHREKNGVVFSADGKVTLSFGAREVGRINYIRAVVRMRKPLSEV